MIRTKMMFVATALAAALAVTVGCNGKVSVEDAKARIEELKAKGVPADETELLRLERHIREMEGAKNAGLGLEFKKYQDSVNTALPIYEAAVAERLERADSFIDSLSKACEGKLASLSGLHLMEAQKGKALVDSLVKAGQKLSAMVEVEKWAAEIDRLAGFQKVADSLRSEFPGIWVKEQEADDPRFREMRIREEIHIWPDGKSKIVNIEKIRIVNGESKDYLLEAYGDWDLAGERAFHSITRERLVRDLKNEFDEQTQRVVRRDGKTYDSTFAKGAKPDFVTPYSSLMKDYKKFPIKGTRR